MKSKIPLIIAVFAAGMFLALIFAGKTPQKPDVSKPAPATASSSSAPASQALPATQSVEAASAPATTSTSSSSSPAASSTSAPVSKEPEVRWEEGVDASTTKTVIGSLAPSIQAKSPGYEFAVEVTNNGAAIYTVKLANEYFTVKDQQLAGKLKDDAQYEREVAANPQEHLGHYSLLNPVPKGAGGPTARELEAEFNRGANPMLGGQLYLPFATRRITIKSLPGGLYWDLESTRWIQEPAVITPEGQSISFHWELYRTVGSEARRPFMRLTKTYSIRPRDYSIRMSLKLENLSGKPLTIALDQAGPTGVPREDLRGEDRRCVFGQLSTDGKTINCTVDNIDNKDLDTNSALGYSDTDQMLWLGQANKFFGSMMYMLGTDGSSKLDAARPRTRYYARKFHENPQSRTFVTSVEVQELTIAPGATSTLGFDVFAGPKKRDLFNDVELYRNLDYIQSITKELSGWCSFKSLTIGIMWLLEFLAKYVTFGNYGVAIIVLVIVVRVLLHPLTKKGQVSMMKMQKLGPKMAELKEKYKDDKDTLQRETMKFYKEQGATPILGCLPMLLQFPIWIALYSGLNAAAELRHAAFLPIWITDLAGQDAIWRWPNHPFEVPLLGGLMGPITGFNLLPLLLTVAMYYQTKLTPTSMTAAPTPQQAQQQKMMKILTPVMMLLFFYNAPAGLTLYVMTSTFSSVAEQMVIRKHIQEKEAAAAAAETLVEMPGKSARSSRTKKPKGPSWFKHG